MSEPVIQAPRGAAVELFCPECGYNLSGIDSPRCPECGTAIDRSTLAEAQIPWAHRGKIGRRRAYWRTVGMVLLRPRKLAAEITRPVSYRDAQVFRWATIIRIVAPIGGLLAMWWVLRVPVSPHSVAWNLENDLSIPTRLDDWVLPLMFLAFAVWLVALTGIPSYFFHPSSLPPEQQNRAIALSYYPSAALLPAAGGWLLTWIFNWICSLLRARTQHDLWMPLTAVSLFLGFVGGYLFISFGWTQVVLLRRTTRCGMLRQAALACCLIACVVILLPLLLLGIPMVIGDILVLSGR